ncbi:TLDc domain-containing protein [Entamoeba marina]
METTIKHNSYFIQLKELNTLKKWSNKQSFNIIFDSDIDGDGTDTLRALILNKSNLYFIHIDDSNNVFGGYLPSTIKELNVHIKDSNSFIFSLIRNGKINNQQYVHIHYDIKESNAFVLNSNELFGLYAFGFYCSADIFVDKIGSKESFCNPRWFNYGNNNINALVNENYRSKYVINRIIVLQMY